jgi:hypothetical protein
MNSQATFKLYWGMNLHFSSIKYSVLTYGINTKAAQTKFDLLTREQSYRFEWLATRFKTSTDLMYACIGCQFENVNMQYDSKDVILDAYFKFKSRRESITHTIKSEFIKHEILDFIPLNKLIYKHLVGEFSPEYVLLLCHGNDDLNDLYASSNLSWARDKILKLMKYSPFFAASNYIHLIENHENHVAV